MLTLDYTCNYGLQLGAQPALGDSVFSVVGTDVTQARDTSMYLNTFDYSYLQSSSLCTISEHSLNFSESKEPSFTNSFLPKSNPGEPILLDASFCPIDGDIVQNRLLLDSGCTMNLIDRKFAETAKIPLKKRAKALKLFLGDGNEAPNGHIDLETQPLILRIGRHAELLTFNVTDLMYPAILGMPWLKLHDPVVSWSQKTLTFSSQRCLSRCRLENKPLTVQSCTAVEKQTNSSVKCALLQSEEFIELATSEELTIHLLSVRLVDEKTPVDAPTIPPEYADLAEVFSKANADKLPEHRSFDIAIELEEGAKPPYGPLYSLSPTEMSALKEYIDENLAKGFIRPSSSPAGSPILFVKKKDGSLRLCVDYRALNSMTKKDRYPLPLIDDLMMSLRGAKWFSTLDLRGAYNLVRVRPGDEWKTAFRTRYGLYEYLVMPFGLTNAPAVFQRLINEVLREFLGKCAESFIDDLIVYTFKDLVEHITKVYAILETLLKNGLYVKLEKCEFHKTSVHFLGFVVSRDGISMDDVKVKAVLDWPAPSNVKQLQAFLGFANFYRRFIKDYSRLTTPLTALTKKDALWCWSDSQQKVFDELKTRFTSAPILAHPDPSRQFVVETDASDFAMGAVLSHLDDDGVLRPVAFWSRKFQGAELNWPIYDKELGAIYFAFEQWRAFLIGATHPVLVWTDHKNLEYFTKAQCLSRRQYRWAKEFQDFHFLIAYRPGAQQGKPDALSRRSDYSISEEDRKTLQTQVVLGPDRFATLSAITTVSNEEDADLVERIRSATAADEFATRSDVKEVKRFEFQQGLLLRESLIYVPPPIRLEILQNRHDAKVAGHFGVARTYELISRDYWWPGMLKMIKQFIASCEVCARSKTSRHKPYGYLKALEVPEQPWTSVTMDFITDLPESNGYNSIVVFVDRFTKMSHFAACKKTTDAMDTAELLLAHVFRLHGVPKEIISDRGPQFISKMWKSFLDVLGVKVKLSTAFHPQTDGQSERVNQVLEQYLRCFLDYQQKDWVRLLPLAEFAYNNTTHASTQFSPFFANFGFHPRFDVTLDVAVSSPKGKQYIMDLEDLHSVMKLHLKDAIEKMSEFADRHRAPAPELPIGSKVWLNRKNIKTIRPSLKLDYKKFGPFKVIERIGVVSYRIDLPPSMKIHNVFHVSLLEPVVENMFDNREIPPPPPVEIDDHKEYEVEEILDSRLYYRKLQYLVRWKGYSISEDKWLPPANLEHCKDMIDEFHSKFPDKPSQDSTAISRRNRPRRGQV